MTSRYNRESGNALLWSVEVFSLHDGCIVTSKEISLESLSFRAWVSALVEQTGVSLVRETAVWLGESREKGR